MDEKVVWLGDCLKIMPEQIADKSVDMVLCDLPYGTTNCKWDVPIDLKNLWIQYSRVCKPNAAILLFAQCPFDKVLGCSNIGELRYEYVWEKTNATGHLNAKKMPLKAHENILVFYSKLPIYNPQKTSGHKLKTATKRKLDPNDTYGAQKSIGVKYASTDRYPRSVITFPVDKQTSKIHPTQKPVKLLEYFIKTYSNEKAVVLDNCAGSGSTGVACLNTNRNYILIEKNAHYFSKMLERLNWKS